MKTLAILVTCFAFSASAQITSSVNDQTTKEPEIIYSGPGKITLETGEEVEGEIRHSLITQNRISIKKTDGTKETYTLKEVKTFRLNNDFYEKVEIPTLAIKDPHFAQLLSSESSPVRIYYIAWQENVSFGSDAQAGLWPTHKEYYALFPSIGKLRDFGHIDFMPFPKKVSKLVSDCPTLAEKISSKEKGYSFSLIATPDVKLQTFINVANGYSACK